MVSKLVRYISIVCASIFLVGCGNSEDESELLRQAVVAGSLKITALSLTSDQSLTILEVGQTWPLTATATVEGGGTVDVSKDVNWVTDNIAIATVNESGVITGGSVTSLQTVSVSASLANFSSSLVMQVSNAALQSVQIASKSISAIDECRSTDNNSTTNRFFVEGVYEDSTTRPLQNDQMTWNTGDASKAVFDATSIGQMHARSGGALIVSATHKAKGFVTPSYSVTVNDVNPTLSSTPAAGNQTADKDDANVSMQVTALFTGSSTSVAINPNTVFSSSAPAVASITSAGVIDFLTVGTTTITAACGGDIETLNYTLRDLTSIALSASKSTSITTSEEITLSVTGTYSTGASATITEAIPVTDITWSIATGADFVQGGVVDANTGRFTTVGSFTGLTGNQIIVNASHKTDTGVSSQDITLTVNN